MLTLDEKLEMMRLKDIYNFGLSIIEMMMGEVNQEWALVALENVPQMWQDLEETTKLVNILSLCLNVNHRLHSSKRMT